LRILIHTGASGVDSPKRFEHFIKAHPNCPVQLAHLKDLDAQEYMLKKYPNVVVDSSFAGENEIGALVGDSIERKRILWGTDMPVTYWWYNVLGKEKIPSIGKEVLTEFYKRNHYPAASQSL
jgi:predicted TIM-barrel fold metal-dependent hydrolase